jgi:hypothetical protein
LKELKAIRDYILLTGGEKWVYNLK